MKVVIIGGMAAGPKTAARLRRLVPDAEITIVEQGELISFGACGMPFYLGNQVPEFESLYATSYGVARDVEFFDSRKNITVLTGTKAVRIDRALKRITVIQLENQQHFEVEYDYLVITTGAEAINPPIEGLNLPGVFNLHDPSDARSLHNYLRERKARHVTVIGAGVIGMEVADALRGRRLEVTMCEAQEQVLPKLLDLDIARLVASQARKHKVDLQLGCMVKSVKAGEDGKVARVITTNGEIMTDAVVVAAGVRPRIMLARNAGLEIAETGAIKVDSHLRTSDPFIFAAGDCASQVNSISGQEVYIPLASIANKQGRVVANNIAGIKTEFNAVMGTTVLQTFDFNIGRTGLGEQEAMSLGYRVIAGITAGHDAPHYYPLHGSVVMKLIADRDSGRLLGAQVCGPGDGVKRLDVLGTAIKCNSSLQDISDLDLGYAPPYAEAIDIAIHAANMLDNKRSGIAQGLSPVAVEQLINNGTEMCFLDVREPDEVRATPLQEKNVLVISASEIRKRYLEVPQDKMVVVVCGLGIRSYEVVCFLQSAGFKEIVYLEGGVATWLQ